MPTYKDLLHYGKIVSDKNHETTEGNFIRFTTWNYEDILYVTIKLNGDIVVLSKMTDYYAEG